MAYNNEIGFIRRKIVYDEEPPLGEMLDIDGDGSLTIRDLWMWKRKASTFRIGLTIVGGTDEDNAIVDMAAKRWEQIIVGKTTTRTYDVTMRITFDSTLPDNVLGQAGVSTYALTDGHYIPTHGIMNLSTKSWEHQKAAKKKDGLSNAYYTVLHEMGHILGIGTMWKINGLLNSDGQYIGQCALREYRLLCKNPNIPFLPIEDDGGAGTAGFHVEEGMEPGVSTNDRVGYKDGHAHSLPGLDKELMTGWAEVDAEVEPLSVISVAMLDDMGYTVDYGFADAFDIIGVQNETDGFLEFGERIKISFVENGIRYSTSVNGYDYLNRVTFSLYITSLNRYITPTTLILSVDGGRVKVSKLVVTREGSSVGEHIVQGTTNIVEQDEVSFDVPDNGPVSRFSIVFVGT